jgi:hypothetical protein
MVLAGLRLRLPPRLDLAGARAHRRGVFSQLALRGSSEPLSGDLQVISKHKRQRHRKTSRTEHCNLIKQTAFQFRTKNLF